MTEKIKELLRDRQKLKDSYVDAITKMDKLNWINNDIANVLETHLQGFEEVLAVPEEVSAEIADERPIYDSSMLPEAFKHLAARVEVLEKNDATKVLAEMREGQRKAEKETVTGEFTKMASEIHEIVLDTERKHFISREAIQALRKVLGQMYDSTRTADD